MKNNTRISRINDEIMKEISQIIRSEVKDPRIGTMTSVIRVDTTADLKYCKVFVSVLGNDEEKQSVMKGLKNASGFMAVHDKNMIQRGKGYEFYYGKRAV